MRYIGGIEIQETKRQPAPTPTITLGETHQHHQHVAKHDVELSNYKEELKIPSTINQPNGERLGRH